MFGLVIYRLCSCPLPCTRITASEQAVRQGGHLARTSPGSFACCGRLARRWQGARSLPQHACGCRRIRAAASTCSGLLHLGGQFGRMLPCCSVQTVLRPEVAQCRIKAHALSAQRGLQQIGTVSSKHLSHMLPVFKLSLCNPSQPVQPKALRLDQHMSESQHAPAQVQAAAPCDTIGWALKTTPRLL